MKAVTGVIYAETARRAAPVQVPTALHPTRDGADAPSFPSFEAVLGAGTQLHEAWIAFEDALGKEHRFLIAAQYSAACAINIALKTVLPEVDWKGGLIVMRGGRSAFVVNMGSSAYKQLARRAVLQYVYSCGFIHTINMAET